MCMSCSSFVESTVASVVKFCNAILPLPACCRAIKIHRMDLTTSELRSVTSKKSSEAYCNNVWVFGCFRKVHLKKLCHVTFVVCVSNQTTFKSQFFGYLSELFTIGHSSVICPEVWHYFILHSHRRTKFCADGFVVLHMAQQQKRRKN